MDWFSLQVLDYHVLEEFGIWPEYVFDVEGVKRFFLALGVCCVVAAAVLCGVVWLVASRRSERATVARSAGLLRTYMGRDLDAGEAFPSGFEELAVAAADIKRDAGEKNRRLAEESARRNDLVTYLAHDLKTPLTSVIGYLSLLDEVPDMPTEQRCRYVGITLDKACRLEALINEFFDITRYNLSHIELERAPVDLAFLLVQMADEFYPQLAAHGNGLIVEVEGTRRTPEEPGAPLTVMADAARLARVLNNLIKNAIAYSEEGTDIEVSARVERGRVKIVVADTGSTIPSHKLRAIFDKFYRLDEARGSGTGGAGLGLAIAREIVELHGGTITAESEQGRTTFTVDLPET
ncbi:hypothetical protein B5F84_05755 [Olsenella sp. An290]|nr:hypothetical protein B5F84_05755 [Olsenella sp. An290]